MNFYKKYKLIKLQNIKKNYKYIYIFRYNDLTSRENIFFKKSLKKNMLYKTYIVKKKIINHLFLNLKGQGSIFLLYTNETPNNFIKHFLKNPKIELIQFISQNNIFSKLKINKILYQMNNPLNIVLLKSIINLLYFLRKSS